MSRHRNFLGSVSDLMAGLMIVFLFIAISYMIEVSNREEDLKKQASNLKSEVKEGKVAKLNTEKLNKQLEKQKGSLLRTNETIREIAATYSKVQKGLHDALNEEFRNDLPRWNATLEGNIIRFNEPEVLFLTGKSDIRSKFKLILQEFFPRYLAIIYQTKFGEEIEEIRIEGHTSSKWEDALGKEERYLKNANLSQQRALAVLSYCFELEKIKNYQDVLIRDFRANGLSFAKLLLNIEGKEDEARSQRVEFRVITKTRERISDILKTAEEKAKVL